MSVGRRCATLILWCFLTQGSGVSYAVTVSTFLDNSPPPTDSAYYSATGTQLGRINRNGTVSQCGALKTNPGAATTVGSRRLDRYRFVALESGCVTVTLASQSDNVLFAVAYDAAGPDSSDPVLNYLADPGQSPTVGTPARSFAFDVVSEQVFYIVVHELDPDSAIGQPYRLELDGVKLEPEFALTETVGGDPPVPTYATAGISQLQAGRLNRFDPPSSCDALKPNPGLFTMSGSRSADAYRFTPQATGCAIVTLFHSGANSAQVVVYDENGYVPSDPSANYLADAGSSSANGARTLSVSVTAGVPFDVVVSELTPGAGTGDSYTLAVGNVALAYQFAIQTVLDTVPAPESPDWIRSTEQQTGRLTRNSEPSDCGSLKANPGLGSASGLRQFDEYVFVAAASGCVQVTLEDLSATSGTFAVAYTASGFNPLDPATNYLADAGISAGAYNGFETNFSFNITAGEPFTIVVHEVNPGQGIGTEYRLTLSGDALSPLGNFLIFRDGFE